MTTWLDIAGLILVIIAAGVAFGLAAALLVMGACCLLLSWSITRAKK
jgi:hypothetical protein